MKTDYEQILNYLLPLRNAGHDPSLFYEDIRGQILAYNKAIHPYQIKQDKSKTTPIESTFNLYLGKQLKKKFKIDFTLPKWPNYERVRLFDKLVEYFTSKAKNAG